MKAVNLPLVAFYLFFVLAALYLLLHYSKRMMLKVFGVVWFVFSFI